MFALHLTPALSVFCNKKKRQKRTAVQAHHCFYLFIFWTVVKREKRALKNHFLFFSAVFRHTVFT